MPVCANALVHTEWINRQYLWTNKSPTGVVAVGLVFISRPYAARNVGYSGCVVMCSGRTAQLITTL